MQCRECKGKGVESVECDHNGDAVDTCWACVSTGGMTETECYYCEGSGQVKTCPDCKGEGCGTCNANGVVPA